MRGSRTDGPLRRAVRAWIARIARGFRILLAACALAGPAAGQETATILADRVVVEGDTLTASGGVEVRFGERRLTASAIRYDRAAEALDIEGPIRIDDGPAVLTASAAALDADLEEGILTSARLTLDRQLQIAAAEVARVGEVSRLTRAVASSCHVCAGKPVPLWEIRAARITYDEAEEILVFDRAQLRISGVPVGWVPRLRLPGPGNDREAGFLVPRVRSTSRLGTGLVAPFFVPLGRSADLTFSPYFSGETRTQGLRYRQALRSGKLEIEGAITEDGLRDGARGYAFLRGRFGLPRELSLDLDLRVASDDEVLLDYGVSDEDRLPSSVAVTRARPDGYAEARVLAFQDLRGEDVAATSPRFQSAFLWDRRLDAGPGTLDLTVSGDAYLRDSSLGVDTAIDGDAIADGRDGVRLGASAAWTGARILPGGLVAEGIARLDADRFEVMEDDAMGSASRVLPTLGTTLRWPLARAAASGAVDVLEPAVALAWTDEGPDRPPNEDSTRPELDEGNFLALTRFPGEDAAERGARASVGLGWRRFGPGGWQAGATLGRVLREEGDERFADGAGQDGETSDWLAAFDLDTGRGLSLGSRTLLGGDGVASAEALLGYEDERLSLDAAYVRVAAFTGPDGIRRDRESQAMLDADLRITRRWSGSAGLRYDFEEERAQTAGLGVVWRNECAEVDVSVLRRFEDESSVDPETRFGLSVALLGFGDRPTDPGASTCDPVFR
jgi:LPS-assembly protein